MTGLTLLSSIRSRLGAHRTERTKVLRAMKTDQEINGRPYGILANLMVYLGFPLTLVTLIGTPFIPGFDPGPYGFLVAFSPAIAAMISGVLGPRLILLHRLKKSRVGTITEAKSQVLADLGELQAEPIEKDLADASN